MGQAVAGLRGSGDFASNERPEDFREMILFRRPNGSAPMLALMSKARKAQVADPTFHWWDEAVDIVRLQVNGALAAGDTTVIVDSGDPDTSAPTNVYGTAKHLTPGTILQVEKTTETAAYDNELLLVESVQSDTQFTVKRGFAGTSAGVIADDTFLTAIGSAYGEGTAAPQATSRNPVEYSNHCQIFKTSYALTGTTVAITNLRTGDALRNDKMRRSRDHSISIEQAIMWGVKSSGTDTNGKPIRTTQGLRSFIPAANTKIFSTAVTYASLMDAINPAFDYESDAGDQRIVFAGNTAINELNKIISKETGVNINYSPKITVYGMRLVELMFPQGTIFLRSHPLMNRHGLYKKSAFGIDFSSIRWRHTKGRDTHFQDNIQAKDEDQKRGQWFTEGGLEVIYAGLTNFYLGNISAT
jgi:hypothetical protein